MRAHVRITGRVQGVGYRAWAVRKACSFGLGGFVRNRHDRSVELVVEGDEANVSVFLALCKQGPLWARVDSILPVSVPDAFIPSVELGVFVSQPTV